MDSQRATVVASAAQAAGITRGIDGTFTTSTDLDDGGGGGGGSVRGRTGRSIGGGRGGRNNAINGGAHGMGGDMDGLWHWYGRKKLRGSRISRP